MNIKNNYFIIIFIKYSKYQRQRYYSYVSIYTGRGFTVYEFQDDPKGGRSKIFILYRIVVW